MPCRSVSIESLLDPIIYQGIFVLFFRLIGLFVTSQIDEFCRYSDQLKFFIFLLVLNKCTNFAISSKGNKFGIKGLGL